MHRHEDEGKRKTEMELRVHRRGKETGVKRRWKKHWAEGHHPDRAAGQRLRPRGWREAETGLDRIGRRRGEQRQREERQRQNRNKAREGDKGTERDGGEMERGLERELEMERRQKGADRDGERKRNEEGHKRQKVAGTLGDFKPGAWRNRFEGAVVSIPPSSQHPLPQ